MKTMIIFLVLAFSYLNADDLLFFKQPKPLDYIKNKVNIVWNNDYNLPLDLYYRIDDVWIKIDSGNIKNHYNNFDLPDADSIWFKIEINQSNPQSENFFQDLISNDESEIRGIANVKGVNWVISKNNYLYNLSSGVVYDIPFPNKSAYGMVSRLNKLIFAQN